MDGTAPIGKRLIPNIVDHTATQTPDRVYSYYAPPDWESNGYQALTWGQIARAIDKVSYWLDERLDHMEDFETFAYAGDNDFRYMFLVVAAIKTGRRILLPGGSKTLSTEGRMSLLEQTNCYTWITTPERLWELGCLTQERPGMKIFTIPSFEFCMDGKPKHYPYTKTYEEAQDDPAFIIHTSGTTGLPKPIVKTNFSLCATDMIQTLSKGGARLTVDAVMGSHYLTPLPAHWLMGIGSMMQLPIFFGVVPILLPMDASMPVTVDLIKRIHKVAHIDGGFYPPTLLKDMCADKEALSLIKELKYVAYGGAPLEQWVGDMFCDSTLIVPFLGTTELGMLPLYEPPRGKEWRYYRFHPASGFRMERYNDELHELVVHRKPEFEALQPVFKAFPELDVFNTKDLYRQYGEDAWLPQGRADDFVKLGGFAKFYASEVESAIERHAGVKSALVGGEGRPVPFLLVEPREGTGGLLKEVWETLNEINENEAKEIRIPKEMVLFADPARPFRMTAKRTLDRRTILKEYRTSIDALYASVRTGS